MRRERVERVVDDGQAHQLVPLRAIERGQRGGKRGEIAGAGAREQLVGGYRRRRLSLRFALIEQRAQAAGDGGFLLLVGQINEPAQRAPAERGQIDMARQLAPLFFFGPADGDFLLIGGRETAHGRRDEIQLVRVERHIDHARERFAIEMRQERLKRVEIGVLGHAQREPFLIGGGEAVEMAAQEVQIVLVDGQIEYAGARVVRQIEEHAGQLVEIAVFSQRKRDARQLLGGQLSAMLDQLVAAAAAERRVDCGILRVG